MPFGNLFALMKGHVLVMNTMRHINRSEELFATDGSSYIFEAGPMYQDLGKCACHYIMNILFSSIDRSWILFSIKYGLRCRNIYVYPQPQIVIY